MAYVRPPPQSHFGGSQQPPYPPQQGGYPPQGGPFPPQNGFQQGLPPPGHLQQGWGQPPPQQGFGYQQPPQGYGPPSFPSPGYDPQAPLPLGDASADAEALHSAMKGFGTNEKQLIRVLSKPDSNHMRLLVHTFRQRYRSDLEKVLEKETSGYFRDGLLALARGPLAQDAYLLNEGIKGMGTKESFLNDVLCGRSNADMRAIKQVYQQTYKKNLEIELKQDLSMKTEKLFMMIVAANRAEESMPYDPMATERDASELHRAMGARVGTDQLTVSSILSSRSDNQLRGIATLYHQKYQESLAERIGKEFSGHMKDALLLMLGRAIDPAMTTATQLEDTMKGLGTKDELLVQRVVRCHWDRAACDQVKRAYQHRYKKDLISRVKGETRGDFERLLVACLE